MRTFLCCIFLSCSLNIPAQSINKKVVIALEHIQKGAIIQGVEELKNASRFNVLVAQYYMGFCFEYGIGVEENPQEAFTMFRKAAERGLPEAMYRLAYFYNNGIGVERNSSRSEEWMARYQQKKSISLLPDIIALYNEGIKHPINETSAQDSENSRIIVSNIASKNNNRTSTSTPAATQPIILQPIPQENALPKASSIQSSDVDIDIPITGTVNSNTFAVIIANENYQDESKVEFAIHDGEIFSEYCKKTLGIPKENIHMRKDATFNNLKTEINWMVQVARAYKGKAHFIFYYAGHGFPDETSRNSYLLPIDGNGSIASTGFKLSQLYRILGDMPSKEVVIFLDACFSGAQRGEGMLTSTRGIAIKPKDYAPSGNVVVFAASNGQQTAYPFKEKGHGMFTYYILKGLKDTKGNTTLGELCDFVSEQVSQQAIVVNSKPQTPTVTSSSSFSKEWRALQMK